MSQRRGYSRSTGKSAAACVVAAVIAVALAAACIWAFTALNGKRMPEGATLVYPSAAFNLKVKNASLGNDGAFAPTTEDPQIVIPFAEPAEVRAVRVALDAPVSQDVLVELYYRGPGEKYSEERVLRVTLPARQKELLAELPAGTYKALRLDFNGVADFSAIEVSAEGLSQTRSKAAWVLLILLALDIVLFVVLLLSYRAKRRRAAAYARRMAQRRRQASGGRTASAQGTRPRPQQAQPRQNRRQG